MQDARLRQVVICQPLHPLPRGLVALAAPPKRTPPEPDHAVPEGLERLGVGRPQRRGVDVVGERGEPFLLPLLRGSPYAVQPL
jgi:hypothetical protein